MQESSSVSQSEERVCDKKTVRVRSKSEHSTSSSSTTTDYQSSTVKSGRSLLQEITQVHFYLTETTFLVKHHFQTIWRNLRSFSLEKEGNFDK